MDIYPVEYFLFHSTGQDKHEFHLNPNELLKESLRIYLHQKLAKIEADIFLIVKKYGVKESLR